jgi:uncharacterized membrane protein
MIRYLLDDLGRNPSIRSAPTAIERILVHLLYLAGLLALGQLAWRVAGQPRPPLSIVAILGGSAGLAAVAVVFLLWAVRHRRTPPQGWFLTHIVWQARTYALVALLIAAGFLLLAVGVLFAAIAPPLAVVIVYGPYASGWLVAIWFASRSVRGYLAFLRASPVGSVIPDPRSSDS